jgi:hypothetical protein
MCHTHINKGLVRDPLYSGTFVRYSNHVNVPVLGYGHGHGHGHEDVYRHGQ